MGVYGGFVDKMPLGAAFNKGLTFRMGQMHGQKYMHKLLELVLNGELDPSFVVSHALEQAPHGYEIFNRKKQLHQGCTQTIIGPC